MNNQVLLKVQYPRDDCCFYGHFCAHGRLNGPSNLQMVFGSNLFNRENGWTLKYSSYFIKRPKFISCHLQITTWLSPRSSLLIIWFFLQLRGYLRICFEYFTTICCQTYWCIIYPTKNDQSTNSIKTAGCYLASGQLEEITNHRKMHWWVNCGQEHYRPEQSKKTMKFTKQSSNVHW